MERVAPSLRASGLVIHSYAWVPSQGALQRNPGEKHMVPVHGATNISFIHSYLSESPVREPSNEILGENILSPSTELLVDGGPGFLRRSFKTLLWPHQCHAAFSMIPSNLAWVDQSPVSQRVIVTLNRLSHPHLLPPPTWSRVEWSMNPRNPEGQTRDWIYGRLLHSVYCFPENQSG